MISTVFLHEIFTCEDEKGEYLFHFALNTKILIEGHQDRVDLNIKLEVKIC